MGKTVEAISDELAAFIGAQKIFFVATAPLESDGHVNLSPKGLDTFKVIGPNEVAYLDLTGSGIETVAHLKQNGRICIMFCAFEGRPKIVRLHGRGEVLVEGATFDSLSEQLPHFDGARSVVRVDVERVSTSCGFGVPLYEFVGERDNMAQWVEKKGPEGIAAYHEEKNAVSIDGLPGFE